MLKITLLVTIALSVLAVPLHRIVLKNNVMNRMIRRGAQTLTYPRLKRADRDVPAHGA